MGMVLTAVFPVEESVFTLIKESAASQKWREISADLLFQHRWDYLQWIFLSTSDYQCEVLLWCPEVAWGCKVEVGGHVGGAPTSGCSILTVHPALAMWQFLACNNIAVTPTPHPHTKKQTLFVIFYIYLFTYWTICAYARCYPKSFWNLNNAWEPLVLRTSSAALSLTHLV